ncbi:hypothetical protein BDV10DRAFT_188312 [Aspergillus recurvatus]
MYNLFLDTNPNATENETLINDLSSGAIVGITVRGVAALAVLLGTLFALWKRRRQADLVAGEEEKPFLGHHADKLDDHVGMRVSSELAEGFAQGLPPLDHRTSNDRQEWHADSGSEAESSRSPRLEQAERKPSITRKFSDCFVWEMITTVLSAGVLIALVVALAMYDDRPQPDWKYISINSLIWRMTTISRACILFSVSEALGQLKHFAVLSSLAIILALGFEPFAQNLFGYRQGNIYNLAERAFTGNTSLCNAYGGPSKMVAATHGRGAGVTNITQLALGIWCTKPIDDLSNRVLWKHGRRVGIYRNIESARLQDGADSMNGARGEDKLAAFMTELRSSPSVVDQTDTLALLTHEIGVKIYEFMLQRVAKLDVSKALVTSGGSSGYC